MNKMAGRNLENRQPYCLVTSWIRWIRLFDCQEPGKPTSGAFSSPSWSPRFWGTPSGRTCNAQTLCTLGPIEFREQLL